MNDSSSDYIKLLSEILDPKRVLTSLLDRETFASDAGFYYLVPKAVVFPMSEEEIQSLFKWSIQSRIPLVFRAGGTSLSGQSITDGVLVEIGRFFKKVEVLDGGKVVLVQPGAIGSIVNLHLKKYKSKIGPDPSSIASAMMGGILSNNSSGMCCGVKNNSYHTLKNIRFVLPDGSIWDTRNSEQYALFKTHKAELSNSILELKNKIISNENLYNKVKSKYLTKNTVGYALNAFLDFEHPLDILAHLLIGSEGTLGFISQAELHTLPDFEYKSTAFLFFSNLYQACEAVKSIKDTGAEALELMDYASLMSVKHIEGVPDQLGYLPEGAAALLIEYQDESLERLEHKLTEAEPILQKLPVLYPYLFTQDSKKQYLYWKVRKGMFPSVGAVRKSGSTVILEDIAFPIDTLAYALEDLSGIFKKHGYDNAIIFGHAKDGNIHFVITQGFKNEHDTQRYSNFINDVVDLVVRKYDGTLKAEHGTGRNMAPFVEAEWGGDAYEIMKSLKNWIDPQSILNPGVIINLDKEIHLKNLKQMPTVEEEVDKCIECGACEPKCPSHDVTLSPRRRIVARRRIAVYKETKDDKGLKELMKNYTRSELETCAVDGLCSMDCPVNINTGDLVKRLRKEQHGALGNALSKWVAKRYGMIEWTVCQVLRTTEVIRRMVGKNNVKRLTTYLNQKNANFPIYPLHLFPSNKKKYSEMDDPEFVYFPTCISRMMGGYGDKHMDVSAAHMELARRANIKIKVPADVLGKCCGQSFSSKGYVSAFGLKANEWVERMYLWTDNGRLPVIMDLTSCTYTILKSRHVLSDANKEKLDKIRIIDSIDWCADNVLPRLEIVKLEKVVLHPVCSTHKLHNFDKFIHTARFCAQEVIVPINSGCCGMAGDRAFFVPELPQGALREVAKELDYVSANGYYSSARTCEMSLSEATQKSYQHLVFLLLQSSKSN